MRFELPEADAGARAGTAADEALWYKDAVIYQLHVKAFFDSNDDGIGDFRGLSSTSSTTCGTSASTCLWLLPFYPVAAEGRRLRHRRLPQRPPAVRHAATTSGASCARRTGAACG